MRFLFYIGVRQIQANKIAEMQNKGLIKEKYYGIFGRNQSKAQGSRR